MFKNLKQNKVLVGLLLVLSVFGLFMIYSASFYGAEVNYGNKFHFVTKQVIGLVVGLVAMVFFSNFNYHKFTKLRFWVLGVSLLVLVLVFVPFIGVESNGARRWIGFGSFTIQSSEIAKFGFVIFASTYLAKNYNKVKKLVGVLPVILAGAVICMLILLEPNLSITLAVGIVLIFMLIVGGIRWRHFLLILIPALCLVPVLIIIEPYRFDRLIAFLNPWKSPRDEGFQLIQSLYALGSGGAFGVGYLNSRQKYLFLPFSESDFIFSVIGEEFGFIGAVVVCLVYLAVIVQGVKIAINAKDRLGALLAFGVTSVICVQVLINIAVVTGSIPPTGIPLPFISAGGSSLVVFWAATGMLLNVSSLAKTQNENVEKKIFKTKLKRAKLSGKKTLKISSR